MKNEIVFFEAKDGKVSLPVQMNDETVWLTQAQMAQLFNKDRTVIGRHIRNAIADGEIDAKTMCAKFAHMGKDADHTLVALTVMIAESKPAEKEMMVNLVMTFLA